MASTVRVAAALSISILGGSRPLATGVAMNAKAIAGATALIQKIEPTVLSAFLSQGWGAGGP